jgi:hypothetical protein
LLVKVIFAERVYCLLVVQREVQTGMGLRLMHSSSGAMRTLHTGRLSC